MAAKPVVLWLALALASPAMADVNVSIGIGLPDMVIGVRVPVYQDLEPIPGYPAYYAPRLRANYFFYDGMYWVFEDDDWFASDWYDGPWYRVDRYEVPVLVLRIPVRYYRAPPREFRRWLPDAAPRWNEHWGRQWAVRRQGWEREHRHAHDVRPPLPTYQRAYSGARYPRAERQRAERERHYRYTPREQAVRRHYERPHAAAPRANPPRANPPRESRPRANPPHTEHPRARNDGGAGKKREHDGKRQRNDGDHRGDRNGQREGGQGGGGRGQGGHGGGGHRD